MSKISTLLDSILAAVYGKDVRQSIHDAIEQCYADVSDGKTLSEEASENAKSAATDAESRTIEAVASMNTKVNAAIADCNAAATNTNDAITQAKSVATDAESRTTAAIASMNTKMNTAIANCNAAATNADAAAEQANLSKKDCDTAVAGIPTQIKEAMSELGFILVDGKLCVKVERNN